MGGVNELNLIPELEVSHDPDFDQCEILQYQKFQWIICEGANLWLLNPTPILFADRADQDQTAMNIQSDLVSSLSNTKILILHNKLLTTQTRLLTALKKMPFQNIVEKGENAGNQHFLLFLQCYLPFPKQISGFQSHLFYHMQMLSIWKSLKIGRMVKS